MTLATSAKQTNSVTSRNSDTLSTVFGFRSRIVRDLPGLAYELGSAGLNRLEGMLVSVSELFRGGRRGTIKMATTANRRAALSRILLSLDDSETLLSRTDNDNQRDLGRRMNDDI